MRACESSSKFISSDFKMSVFESGSTYACALASVHTSCSSAGETARWRIFTALFSTLNDFASL